MVQVHPPLPTPPTPTPDDPLDQALERLLAREPPRRGERWLIAFSGGPDSTALAAALAPLAAARELAIELVHVDHGIDAGSAARAARAGELAARLGLPFHRLTVDVPAGRRRRESPEAAARRLRYAALEALRGELGATLLLTAHHRDDQIETVLLQIARGVAVERLGGIATARGAVRRPLLAVRRAEIAARLARAGIEPIHDPTNDDPAPPRNRMRRRTLPALRAGEPGLDGALIALAARAGALRAALDRIFTARRAVGDRNISSSETEKLEAFIEGNSNCGGSVAAEFLRGLPAGLQLPALRWLLTTVFDAGQLPSLPSMKAFLSLLRARRGARLGLPGAPRRQLVARRERLALAAPESRTAPFSYTFLIPGEVELPELGLRLRIRRSPVEPWMYRGEPRRAGFAADATRATVRSRRAGDRLTPLGAPGRRKLKAVLIDRGVPAAARDRLPLLEIAGELAWVPGITIGEAFALRDGATCWQAELEPLVVATADGPGSSERTRTT